MPDVGRMTTEQLEELQELIANELKARQVPLD